MLELTQYDLDIYKTNLNGRQKKFAIHSKRNDRTIVINGKKVVKLRRKNTMTTINKQEAKSIFSLFASVKKSINRHIVANNFQIPTIEKKYNSLMTNKELFDSLPIGTQFYYVDVKHCYWRIAYLNGYISEYYYKKVLESPDLKLYRNMALSLIIAPRRVQYYKNGEEFLTIMEDTSLYQTIYENIRHYSWNLFGKMAFERVGKENCIGYYTDGIMIFPRDLSMVRTILARQKLQHRVIACEKTEHREYVYLDEGDVKKFG
jgi:hypothetical protein